MGGASSSDDVPSGVQGVCPAGWHLPSSAEWDTLINFVGGTETAGRKLKSTRGWNNGNGTDNYGFSALPGGGGWSGGSQENIAGRTGVWWSATERDNHPSGDAWFRRMGYYDYDRVYRSYFGKIHTYSVRCVQDE
jgi:uncharacterized protein (TIGR02145 family)